MIRNIITIFALLFSVSTTSSFAQVIQRYTDPRGNVWNRWVETEKTQDGYLLIVVENPAKHSDDIIVSQVPIYKRHYSFAQVNKFESDKKYFSELQDITLRPKSYYEKNEKGMSVPGQALWTPVRDWTWQDEVDYSIWFRQNMSASVAVGQGVQFDCADFGVLSRWIYAHDKRLPVANTLTGSGKLFGHWSGTTAWDKLPTDPDWRKDLRFKEAIKYLMLSIYTHSISKDLYPVEITNRYVTPGTILLNLYNANSGHTQVIHKVGAECNGRDCMTVLYGNEPASEYAYADIAWIQNVKKDKGGFLRWRWPVKVSGSWKLTSSTSMPGYSLEQYNHGNLSSADFGKLIYTKLGMNSSPLGKTLDALDSMASMLGQRIMITISGHFLCHVQICDMNSQYYNDYSTPSRDLRFREAQNAFYYNLNQVPQQDLHWVEEALNELKQSTVLGTSMSFADYVQNTNNIWSKMSSDPTKSIFERWGVSQRYDKYIMLTYAWSIVMAANRMTMVQEAQVRCFSNSSTPTCNQLDVQSLRTDRLDLSVKQVRQLLRKDYPSLGVDEKIVVNAILDSILLLDYSARVYLLENNNWVDNMSALPWDNLKKRWGFE